MKTMLAFVWIILGGCTTVQEAVTTLQVDKEIQAMSRAEVIAGINECESAGQRAVVLSAKRRINGQVIPAPVEVTCLPKIKW
jgi:membrane-bound ClpP family serine protease